MPTKLPLLAAALLTVPLAGCASSISAWKARPVAAHDLSKERFFTMTGERRLAFFVNHDADRKDVKVWCAEALPDAAMTVKASTSPTLKIPSSLEASLADAFETGLVKTYDRQAVSDIFRQATFFACSAYANRVYNLEEYKARTNDILKTMQEVTLNLSKHQEKPAQKEEKEKEKEKSAS
jgi:hypothetical protein